MFQQIAAIFLTAAFLFSIPLNAEIMTVKLKWNPALCQYDCNRQMNERLSAIPAVTGVKQNPSFGEVELSWRPHAPFSFAPINTASRLVGIRISGVIIKVRGTVSSQGNNINIISLGDNTSFRLLGPLVYDPNRFVISQSEYSHPLSPEMRQRLIQAERNHQLIVVDGTLFQPERMQNRIVIADIKFEDNTNM